MDNRTEDSPLKRQRCQTNDKLRRQKKKKMIKNTNQPKT
jgi:hypothetical protein